MKASKFSRWLKQLKADSLKWLKNADNLASEFTSQERQRFSFDLNAIIGNLVTLKVIFDAERGGIFP